MTVISETGGEERRIRQCCVRRRFWVMELNKNKLEK
jgi:hypothetical protein